MKTQNKINNLINEVNKTTAQWSESINNICNELPYIDSSKFSYNSDKLKEFVTYLNEFYKMKD